MPSHFTLRMQFRPNQDPEEIKRQVMRLVKKAPVDEVTLFFFAEEQNDGHDELDRVRKWISSIRPCCDALKAAGLKVSLNPWHTVLHCDRGRKLKPGQKWQNMIDPEGRVATAVVCPLDRGWQDYYKETLRLYAKEGFRVLWIDDDIRYHNHGPLKWGGCFCPLHVAEFNRRTGNNANREEIVSACLAPGKPHPWRELWFGSWQENILKFLEECRVILDEGNTRMGLMSSGIEAHGAEGRRWEEWYRVFGGGKAPVQRPHFWGYSDAMGFSLANSITALDQGRTLQAEGIESGPEIENFPYGQWNKSYRQSFAQMALAHVLGSTNLNISIYDFMGNNPDDEPGRAEFLKKIRPSMDWLADKFPMSMKSSGIGMPWSQELGRSMRTKKGEQWHELHCPAQGWSTWLAAAGFAFSAREQEHVNAISGPLAWTFSDGDLKRLLGKGLLLDGSAAAVIEERGLGHLAGIKKARCVSQEELLYSIEEGRDAEFSLRPGIQNTMNGKPHTAEIFQFEPAPGARQISVLLDPLQREVGHGVILFENELGGRTAVFPWLAHNAWAAMMNVALHAQMSRVLAWLGKGAKCGSAKGSPWLIPQFMRDGNTWRGVVWNASPDEAGSFEIECPEGMKPPNQAWQLKPDGTRTAAAIKGELIIPGEPLRQWDLIVFE